MQKLKFIKENWKLLLHLFFDTYRFGVNNKWWSSFNSLFGVPWKQRYRLIYRYKLMRIRAEMGFVARNEFIYLFPLYSRRKGLRWINGN